MSETTAVGALSDYASTIRIPESRWPWMGDTVTIGSPQRTYPDLTLRKVANGFVVKKHGQEYIYRNMVELTEYLTTEYGE